MSARRPTPRALRPAALVLPALLGTAACTHTPDPCEGAKYACLAVTVESGPPEVYQLAVRFLDGFGSGTPYTPRKRPTTPLTYPLRLGLRFEQFDMFYKGQVTFEIDAIREDIAYPVAQLRQTVELGYDEKKAITVSLGPLFDMGGQDLSSPPDLSTPADLSVPPDLATPADLAPAEVPDMAHPDMAQKFDMP